MAKAPKKPVELLERIDVNIGTGFKFRVGDPIRPGFEEVQYVIRTMFDRGYLTDELLPVALDPATILSMNATTLMLYLPGMLGKLNTKFDQGIYDVPKDTVLVICIYVLSWFWYRNGGPEPITPKRTKKVGPRRVTPVLPALECPFCFRKFTISPRYKLGSVVYAMWVAWLIRHGTREHHWNIQWDKYVKPSDFQKK